MFDGLQGQEGLEMRKVVPPLGAWALSIGCTVGWGSFVMPSSTFLPKAGPWGTAIAFAFGFAAMLVVALNYGYLAQRCPIEGGVYSYAHSAFGPNHAFVCSWCLVLAYSSAMIANATALALVIRSVFGSVLQVGFHYVAAGYNVYMGEVLLGMFVMTAAAYVCARSVRLTALLETFLSIGLLVGILVIALLAFTSDALRPDALQPAFSPHTSPLAGTLMVVAAVPWSYIGFEAVTQVTGECRFPLRHLTRVMVVSILCGTLMYVVLNTVTAAFIPAEYPNWVAYLEALPSVGGTAAIPSFAAGAQMAGRLGVFLFFFTALCAVLSGVLGFFVAASRLIHTMAVDGALSHRYARLHAVYRTPVVATMVVFTVSLVMPLLGRNVLTWIVDLMSLGALVAYLYTSLATVHYARDEHDRMHVALGFVGVLVSVLCLSLLIVPIPRLGTSLSKESYIILFTWVALGVNFFTPTLVRQGREG